MQSHKLNGTGAQLLPEKVTRKYLESPEKDTYTHYDMSVYDDRMEKCPPSKEKSF